MNMPSESDVPEGFRVMEDHEIVKAGDVVLDYQGNAGFAEISVYSKYTDLIGMNADDCRLASICFEVFTKVED